MELRELELAGQIVNVLTKVLGTVTSGVPDINVHLRGHRAPHNDERS